ncbi:MAG: DUF4141 domain-containing protein [Bacteroidia bacterium]|nr:DUF4141 domain-containing protein [Bacteroidia bacterium]
MRKRIRFLVLLITISICSTANAQWVTFDPSNLAQGIVNTTRQIVETSTTAQNMIRNFEQTVKIYEQGRQYYDALKSVHNLVKDARKVQKTVLLIGEISDIYVTNYQRMLSDKNYTVDELSAIASGYAKLLEESTDAFAEMKTAVSVTGLSMTDKERMDQIDQAYNSVKHYRDLVSYYTRKNISVSYLRAKKTNDLDRVLSLYGGSNDRYW